MDRRSGFLEYIGIDYTIPCIRLRSFDMWCPHVSLTYRLEVPSVMGGLWHGCRVVLRKRPDDSEYSGRCCIFELEARGVGRQVLPACAHASATIAIGWHTNVLVIFLRRCHHSHFKATRERAPYGCVGCSTLIQLGLRTRPAK